MSDAHIVTHDIKGKWYGRYQQARGIRRALSKQGGLQSETFRGPDGSLTEGFGLEPYPYFDLFSVRTQQVPRSQFPGAPMI